VKAARGIACHLATPQVCDRRTLVTSNACIWWRVQHNNYFCSNKIALDSHVVEVETRTSTRRHPRLLHVAVVNENKKEALSLFSYKNHNIKFQCIFMYTCQLQNDTRFNFLVLEP
jgi:hypothetical protein